MTSTAEWIGEPPRSSQLWAILTLGIVGTLMLGLQPLLLGALATQGRITSAQLGQAATAELLVMGLAAVYAGSRWRPEHLRTLGVISALSLAVIDVSTLWATAGQVTLARALAGVPSGIMVWITIAVIARSPTPERWAGIYLTLQTLTQFVAAAALTVWVVPDFGANGGLLVVAALCGCAAIVAMLMPDRLAPLIADELEGHRPNSRGWLALGAIFLWMACITSVWVYLEPLSRQAGHPPSVAGAAVSLSLGCQVLGGIAATVLAGRVGWFAALATCALLDAACLFVFAVLPGPTSFLVTAGVFGFLWLFTLPFLVPMAIAADATRRTAVLVGGAELLGGSAGPLLVSFLVTESSVRAAVIFGGCVLAPAFVMSLAVRLRERASGKHAPSSDVRVPTS